MFNQPVLPGFGRGRGFINDVSFGRGRGRGRGRGVVIDRRFGFTPIEQLVDTRKSKPLVLTKDQVIEKKENEKNKTYIDITKLPEEIIIQILNSSDYQLHSVCRLSQVSKEFYKIFKKESIWKQLYENKSVIDFYNYRLSRLSEIDAGQTIDKERKTKLVVVNNSYFDYDVFMVKIIETPSQYKGTPCQNDEFTELVKLNKEPIKPTDFFVKNSYHKTRIIVIPTVQEILSLQFSNIGHSFSVNKLRETNFKGQMAHVKTIKQPKKLLPITIIKQENKTFKEATTANYMEKYNKELFLDISGTEYAPTKKLIWNYTERVYVDVYIYNNDLANRYKKVTMTLENSGQKHLDDMIREKHRKKKEVDDELKILKHKMKLLENTSKEYKRSIDTLTYVKSCF